MEKAMTLEIWVDDTLSITDRARCVEEFYRETTHHFYLSDGSIAIKLIKTNDKDVCISTSELKEKVDSLVAEGHEYVELTLSEENEFEGHVFPKGIQFDGLNGEGGCVDFESIDHEKVSSTYKWDRENNG